MMSQRAVLDWIGDAGLPAYKAQRDEMDRIDRWYRWEHDPPHRPRHATSEYRELSDRAQTPWLSLVVTAIAQALYVEGYREVQADAEAEAWGVWQRNGFDARQIAVHRAALAYGRSYVTVLPGTDSFGETMPVLRGVSPRHMVTFWMDESEDEYPAQALRVDRAKVGLDGNGKRLRLYDSENVYEVLATSTDALEWLDSRRHDVGVCPVVRYANMLDLEGRSPGEVEPFIPVAGRIDQTVFDRLVVQRFSSWVVRTIAGMSQPDTVAATGETPEQVKLRLKVSDLLIAENADTKFGTLAATPLNGFIDAKDADIRDLAAVTQTPPHHLLGQISNLSAEALAAAEASLNRKVEERKHAFGESHEQVLRLASHVAGDRPGATDFSAQVRWRDMESRSLAQAADALGKLAQMLQVPVEMLWEKVPGWTQTDVNRAKQLASEGGGIEALMQELMSAGAPGAVG